MDFFATGGFQQLFSDLDEHTIEHDDYHMMEAIYNKHTNDETPWSTAVVQINEIVPKRDDFFGATKSQTLSCHEGFNAKDANRNLNDENRLCGLSDSVTSTPSSSSSSSAIDWNNNSLHQHCNEIELLSEKQLQYSLDLLLPLTTDDDDELTIANQNETDFSSTTAYYITRDDDINDWEERFLDNYIEIPELIDFLPEKTPLCTDECELFLQESSKNLRLHRKRKQAHTSTSSSKSSSSSSSSCGGGGGVGGDTSKAGYTCNFGDCRKVYAKPAHLKAHLRRHLGEKPYVCNWSECTWRFSRSDELARHRRSHSGVKPYKCDYCTKCFARSDHLTKHRKVHERRLLAASKAGKVLDGEALPYSILTVRPGRKRKNQIC